MKKFLDLHFNQYGVTLVELLFVIVITGILADVIFQMYRVALISWKSGTNHSQFAINVTNMMQNITSDIHEANLFQEINNNRIVFQKKDYRVRYSVQSNADKIQLIREKSTIGLSDWHQNPKYPIADFSATDKDYKPTISFKKMSSVQLMIKVTSQNFKLETAVARRN